MIMEITREAIAMMSSIVKVCTDSIDAASRLYLNSATSSESSERLTELLAIWSLSSKIVAQINKYVNDETHNSESPIVNR